MAIDIKHATLSFDDLLVLDDVSLSIPEGAFVSLVAPSGAGKSTLLKAMAGLLPLTSGEIVVDGATVDKISTAFSYMPQDHLLFPWLSVRQNAVVWQRINHQPIDWDTVAERLEIFGLTPYKEFFPAQLSGGLKQRAALLRSVNNPAKYLLLDEPFGALDSMTRTVMQDWFLRLPESVKRTTVLVTHDISEAVYLSTDIYVLSGRPAHIKRHLTLDTPFSERNRTWLAERENLTQEIFALLQADSQKEK